MRLVSFLFLGAIMTCGCDGLVSSEQNNQSDSSSNNQNVSASTSNNQAAAAPETFTTITENEAFQMIVRYRKSDVKIKKANPPSGRNKGTLWAEFPIASIANPGNIVSIRVLTGAFTKDNHYGRTKNKSTIILRLVRRENKDGKIQDVVSYVIPSQEDVCPEPFGCTMNIPEQEPPPPPPAP